MCRSPYIYIYNVKEICCASVIAPAETCQLVFEICVAWVSGDLFS